MNRNDPIRRLLYFLFFYTLILSRKNTSYIIAGKINIRTRWITNVIREIGNFELIERYFEMRNWVISTLIYVVVIDNRASKSRKKSEKRNSRFTYATRKIDASDANGARSSFEKSFRIIRVTPDFHRTTNVRGLKLPFLLIFFLILTNVRDHQAFFPNSYCDRPACER